MRTVHLLISPEAGRGRAAGARDAVLETIRAAGHSPADLTGDTAAASSAAARAAVADGAERLVVVGGDGLVHLALQTVAATDTVLGIVPVGTGNDFARGLGLPDDPVEALLAVANTGWFGGGMQISPDADPDDGRLDVTVVGDVGRIELLRFFRLVFDGRHMTHPKVHGLRGREIRIEADDLMLWGDGETLGRTPSRLEAVPGALRLAH
jgi:diacylglycerol kinase family enzyme